MSLFEERKHAALLVIDVQNNVVDGAFALETVVASINNVINKARAANVSVIWVQHSDEELTIGSKGWQIVPELLPLENEPIIRKIYRSSFESTELDSILESLKPFTGNGCYVFPSLRTPNGSRPLSDVALLAALRRLGYSKDEITVHGFRATARTLLDEVLKYRPDYIEHQLAHSVRDPLGRAYNRTTHIVERKKMMQEWSDFLDNIRDN